MTSPFDALKPEPWTRDALCIQIGYGDLWYPEPHRQTTHQAKAVCARRPLAIREACLDYAMRTEHPSERFGIYGGTSPAERRALAREEGAGE